MTTSQIKPDTSGVGPGGSHSANVKTSDDEKKHCKVTSMQKSNGAQNLTTLMKPSGALVSEDLRQETTNKNLIALDSDDNLTS